MIEATPTATYMNHRQIRDFYLPQNGDKESIFDIWERGEARGDSVTPSTYCEPYRVWMSMFLRELLGHPGERQLISVGCGNAAVEAELVMRGHRVFALDILDEAIELARRKGIAAERADVMRWSPATEDGRIVYADGLLGHLYDAEHDSIPAVRQVHSWLTSSSRDALVISNDEAQNGDDVQPASGVPGFHWFSEVYLRRQVLAAGFADVSCTRYIYERPLSGPRSRLIVVARI